MEDPLQNEIKLLKKRLNELQLENEELNLIKGQLEAILTNIPVVLWVLDKDGKFKVSRGAGLKDLGLEQDQVVGMSVYDVYAEFPQIISAHNDAYDGKNEHYSFTLQGNQYIGGGEKKVEQYYDARVKPIYDTNGTITGIIGIALNVSKAKLLSKEKEKLREQLLIAQKIESLGVVAGGVAHDFNNLLLGIIGNASLLEKYVSNNKEALAFVEQIKKISEDATNLTKQMLAYTGKTVSNKEYLSLNKIINDITKLISISISKSISVKYDLVDNKDKILADASQIKQIIINLVINASESIGNNNGTITIVTGKQVVDEVYKHQFTLFNITEGEYLYLEISDSGEGIARELIPKIFDPFYTTKFSGRGLGLSVVHGIVKGHNGAIKVYSEFNKGTSFKILFPIEKEITEKEITEKETKKDIPNYLTGKVLLCDDEENIREICGKMLEYLGFNPILVSNGIEAIKILEQRKNEIKLVILDLTMPKMSGKETLNKINLIFPEIPVILSSGYNEVEVIEMLRDRTNIGFLQKPYTLNTLKEKILECIHQNTH